MEPEEEEIDQMYQFAKDLVEKSNWKERLIVREDEEITTNPTCTYLDDQQEPWQNRYYVIFYAWALALGLELNVEVTQSRNNKFFDYAHDIIALARCGSVDWKTINEFLLCHGFVTKGPGNAKYVPEQRRFASTRRFLSYEDLQAYLLLLQRDDEADWETAGMYDRVEIGLPSKVSELVWGVSEQSGDGEDQASDSGEDPSSDSGEDRSSDSEEDPSSDSGEGSGDDQPPGSGDDQLPGSGDDQPGSGEDQPGNDSGEPVLSREEAVERANRFLGGLLNTRERINFGDAVKSLRDYLDDERNGMTHEKFDSSCAYFHRRFRLLWRLYCIKSRRIHLNVDHELYHPTGRFYTGEQVMGAIMSVVCAIDRLQAYSPSRKGPFHGGFTLATDYGVHGALVGNNNFIFGYPMAHPRRCWLMPIVIDGPFEDALDERLGRPPKQRGVHKKLYGKDEEEGGHIVLVVLQEEDCKGRRGDTEFRMYLLDSSPSFTYMADEFIHERVEQAARSLRWTGTPTMDQTIPFKPQLERIPVPSQGGHWQCGLHTIINAWIIALGLTLRGEFDRGTVVRVYREAPVLIYLAYEGGLDWRTLAAWLICKGLVEESRLDDVRPDRRFLSTQVQDGELSVDGIFTGTVVAIATEDDREFRDPNADANEITVNRSNNYDFGRIRALPREYEESMDLEYDTYEYPDELGFLSDY
jgi:hypothetical protein